MNTPKYIDYSKNILIAGVVRNCSNKIRKDFDRINKSVSGFENTHWLVIESDSQDQTVDALKEISKIERNFRFITCGDLKHKIPSRTERIAYCRNIYIEEIQENILYKSIDYLLVVDLDNINQLISKSSFESCWVKNPEEWAACTANQLGPYYDIFALRHPLWSPNDCFKSQYFLEQSGLTKYRSLIIAVYDRMLDIDNNGQWIEVESSFGGLAVYNVDFLKRARYSGIDDEGLDVCEHVFLNNRIRENKGSIFINSNLINANYTEHTRYLIFGGKLFLWLKVKIITYLNHRANSVKN